MTKILVIDDETILCNEVVEWLTLEGYEATGANDGMAGIENARRSLPDLIICDITMPHLDGYGVLLELRANPATMNIPFIFVTARASYEDVRQGMDLGADDYITKPFSRLELLQAIQTRLAKKEIQEQNHQAEIAQWQAAFEQEREKRLFKSKLIAMFSHDFRNPLTSIMSSNSLLRSYADRMDEARQQKYHNNIEASVRRLTQMLDEMLVIAQMETNNLECIPEALNITSFLQRIVEEFQTMHETHLLVFESQYTNSLMADPRLIRQMATNLISNAIKYSPQGSEVRVLLEEQANEQVVLTVQDQGIGIPTADQPRLFAAFQRASNVGKITGTGLGLAIVKQAADLHGGSIQLESAVGSGTIVRVAFPLQATYQ